MSLSDPRWVDVDVEGEYTGTKYHGRFQLKPFLMVSEKTEVVLLAQKLKKGLTDTNGHTLLLEALAFLSFHIQAFEAPWWSEDGLNMLDESPIYELSNKLREFQESLRPKKPEEDKAAE